RGRPHTYQIGPIAAVDNRSQSHRPPTSLLWIGSRSCRLSDVCAPLDLQEGATRAIRLPSDRPLWGGKATAIRVVTVLLAWRLLDQPGPRTVGETLRGFEMAGWYGAYGPAGMSKEIVAMLNAEIGRILFRPEVKKRMEDIAVETAKSSPEEL